MFCLYHSQATYTEVVCPRNTLLPLAIKKLFKLIQIKISYMVEEKTSQMIQKLSYNIILGTDFFL